MLSGHYSFTYTHPQNWLVLVAMMAAGAAIRQFFVLRHGYLLRAQWPSLALCGSGAAVIVGWSVVRPGLACDTNRYKFSS